jgi:hypothetical protein
MSATLSFLVLAILGSSSLAFVPSNSRHLISRRKCSVTSDKPSRLFGISEWREQALIDDSSSPTQSSSREWSDDREGNEMIRHLPIHVVNSNQVALQGETLYFQFTRDDEVRLFQQAIDCHEGVFGLGFHSDNDGILYDKISLVEIKDYNMMGDEFGIFLAVQVVGRAMIFGTDVRSNSSSSSSAQDEERQPLVSLCSEILNRQELVTLAKASEMGKAAEKLIAEVCNAENESSIIVGEDEENRWDRYREAYHRALELDALGYTYSALDSEDRRSSLISDSSDRDEITPQYSWRELNAISWAAFSTSEFLKQDEPYRLAALDNDCVTNRLLLATYWLSDVLQDVKQGAI